MPTPRLYHWVIDRPIRLQQRWTLSTLVPVRRRNSSVYTENASQSSHFPFQKHSSYWKIPWRKEDVPEIMLYLLLAVYGQWHIQSRTGFSILCQSQGSLRQEEQQDKTIFQTRPLEDIAIDFLGALQKTRKDNQYIIVINDRYRILTSTHSMLENIAVKRRRNVEPLDSRLYDTEQHLVR